MMPRARTDESSATYSDSAIHTYGGEIILWREENQNIPLFHNVEVRLNNIALLHRHEKYVANVDTDLIMKDFISLSAVRRSTFALRLLSSKYLLTVGFCS